MRLKIAVLLVLLSPAYGMAQPQPLPFPVAKTLIPPKIVAKAGRPVILDASAAKGKIKWRFDFDPSFTAIDNKKLAFASPYNGTYNVLLISFDDAKDELCTITVTDGQPAPPVPDPPIPDPATPVDPAQLAKLSSQLNDIGTRMRSMDARLAALEKTTPPIPPIPPKPSPKDLPIPGTPGEGLKVLIVFKTLDKSKYPESQVVILTSKTVRDYLNAKCALGLDGKQKEYRIWDQDVDATYDLNAKVWQAVMKRPRQSLPWIVISNGTTGYEGPLPADVDSTMTLLKKYGDPATSGEVSVPVPSVTIVNYGNPFPELDK